MRPLVVKGQKYPLSGFLLFFRVSQPNRCHLATCPDLISVGWCLCNLAAPHPYGGSLAVCTTRAGSAPCVLCDRETSRCPRPVLVKRQDKRETFSSEGQARGRSSTRAPRRQLSLYVQEPAEGSHQPPRAQGECPRRSAACRDAVLRALESVYGQGHPMMV